MSGPPDGKFLIISTAIPRPSIGADNRDDCAVKAAITDGEMRVVSHGPLVLFQHQQCSYYGFTFRSFPI